VENGRVRFRAKSEQLQRFKGLLPEGHGQNLALTVLYVPYSLESGRKEDGACQEVLVSTDPASSSLSLASLELSDTQSL